MDNKANRKKKSLVIGIICFFIITGFLLYYQLMYRAETVDSQIFKLNTVLTGHKADVWSVRFSPDGRYIASGSVDSTLKIWNKQTGALLLNLKQPGGITYIAFSPNGQFIATSSYDEKIRLWKLPEGSLEKEFIGHKSTVWSICFSPDGKTLASSGEDATIKLWSVPGGVLTASLSGHTLNVWDVKFSPDGKTIASGSFDKTIKLWDAASGKPIKTLTGHSEAVVALAFSPDGRILASTSDDKSVNLWNTTDWRPLRTLTMPEHVQAVDFSPDNKWLLTGGRDKPMIGEFLQNFLGDSEFNPGISMRLWKVETGELLQTFAHHTNDVNDVSFSPGGDWIGSGSSDKTVDVWHLSNSVQNP